MSVQGPPAPSAAHLDLAALYRGLVQLRDDLVADKRPDLNIPPAALKQLRSIPALPLFSGPENVSSQSTAPSHSSIGSATIVPPGPATLAGISETSLYPPPQSFGLPAASRGALASTHEPPVQGSEGAQDDAQQYRYGEPSAASIQSSNSVIPSGTAIASSSVVVQQARQKSIKSPALATALVKTQDENGVQADVGLAGIRLERKRIESEIKASNKRNRESMFREESPLPNVAKIHQEAMELVKPVAFIDPSSTQRATSGRIVAASSRSGRVLSHTSFDTNDYYSSQDNELSSGDGDTLDDTLADGPVPLGSPSVTQSDLAADKVVGMEKMEGIANGKHVRKAEQGQMVAIPDDDDADAESEYSPPDPREERYNQFSDAPMDLDASDQETSDDDYVPKLDEPRNQSPRKAYTTNTSRPLTRVAKRSSQAPFPKSSSSDQSVIPKQRALTQTGQVTRSVNSLALLEEIYKDDVDDDEDSDYNPRLPYPSGKPVESAQATALSNKQRKVLKRTERRALKLQAGQNHALRALAKEDGKQEAKQARRATEDAEHARLHSSVTTRSATAKKRAAPGGSEILDEPREKRSRHDVAEQVEGPVFIKPEPISPPPLSAALARAHELARLPQLQPSSEQANPPKSQPKRDLRRIASLHAMQTHAHAQPFPAHPVPGLPSQAGDQRSIPFQNPHDATTSRPTSPYVHSSPYNSPRVARPPPKTIRDQFGNLYVAVDPADQQFYLPPPPPPPDPRISQVSFDGHHSPQLVASPYYDDTSRMPPPPAGMRRVSSFVPINQPSPHGERPPPSSLPLAYSYHQPPAYSFPPPSPHPPYPQSTIPHGTPAPHPRAGSMVPIVPSPAVYSAPHQDVIYLDSGPEQTYAQITTHHPPPHYSRPPSMVPLPAPQSQGFIREGSVRYMSGPTAQVAAVSRPSQLSHSRQVSVAPSGLELNIPSTQFRYAQPPGPRPESGFGYHSAYQA